MSALPLLTAAAAGMAAERNALDVEARNIAAAQAASPGHEYRRLVAQFAFGPTRAAVGAEFEAASSGGDEDEFGSSDGLGDDGDADMPVVRFTGTAASREPADTMTELVAVLDAERAYEANASVFDVGKRLAERTLDVERT